MKFPSWFPYAVAVGLMALGLVQALDILQMENAQRKMQAALAAANHRVAQLEQSNALVSLHLVLLDAQDPAYANAKVFVAWDANQHRGSIALKDFPLTPAGHDYQLWVLDPNAPSPVSAGVLKGARPFEVPPVSVAQPGFAITLEPAGGSAVPTPPILFAVAPAE